ncbi:Mitochondrial carrier domain-containing protein [Cynara cardunculus var. scolymus]|uniref:Mitochondrial carrier domain-containing protein n=1 Tax=Cynara cardunculus var. scolymus TaxID=59895 RepID=A0A124SI23_CYNCS|nr:Mitochondrial carrier domain-containing protein [Cynara cardunculus var. scolymus]
MIPKNNQPILIWKAIPGLQPPTYQENVAGFACVSMPKKKRVAANVEFTPTTEQVLKHPLAVVALVPKEAALFAAGAVAGAAAKTVTAPLDRIKLIMQALVSVGTQEGVKGYWKGNLAQVLRILPYSAVQLFAYESYKKLYRGKDGELSVIGRLAAGASAGMTSTFVRFSLLFLLSDFAECSTLDVVVKMLKEEGLGSFYRGLVPSLIGIAPYVAVNFCVFDLVKKSLPEKFRNKTEASLITAFAAATIATLTCYPLDTIRRQMQMRGTPYKTVLDAFPGIIARDGVAGLYRGFVPNALKTLPNSSIRLTTFDAMKHLIAASEKEFQRIMEENTNSNEEKQDSSSSTS